MQDGTLCPLILAGRCSLRRGSLGSPPPGTAENLPDRRAATTRARKRPDRRPRTTSSPVSLFDEASRPCGRGSGTWPGTHHRRRWGRGGTDGRRRGPSAVAFHERLERRLVAAGRESLEELPLGQARHRAGPNSRSRSADTPPSKRLQHVHPALPPRLVPYCTTRCDSP